MESIIKQLATQLSYNTKYENSCILFQNDKKIKAKRLNVILEDIG